MRLFVKVLVAMFFAIAPSCFPRSHLNQLRRVTRWILADWVRLSACQFVLATSFLLLGSYSRAEDATVTITQDALNAYAMAVGTVSHSMYARVTYDLPDLCWMMYGGGDPTGTLNWRAKIAAIPQGSAAVGSDGTVYAGANDWNAYAFR